jgi:hypothetical protein
MPASTMKKPNRRAVRKPATKTLLYGGIGDDAVKKATGKAWKQWFTVLDKAGGAQMDHKQIVALLADKHDVGPWWQQMVTVGYEQARGKRVKHQTAAGYSVSASRTFDISAAGAFLWWKLDRCRRQWLGDADVRVHHATPSKSIRATWNASTSKPMKSISVGIIAKGKQRAVMAIEHAKLASEAEAKRMKTYWTKQLHRLEQLIAEAANGR